jgi:hypothetical protein
MVVTAWVVGGCSDSSSPTAPCLPARDDLPIFDLPQALVDAGATVEDLGEPLGLLVTPARWRSLRVDGSRIEWYRYCNAEIAESEARGFHPGLPAALGNPPLEDDRQIWLKDDAYVFLAVPSDPVEALIAQVMGPPIVVFAAGT